MAKQDFLAYKDFLNEKVYSYQNENFIPDDPIQIPHSFSKKEDIEISGFLTATISWGNRKAIIKNATRMMELLDHAPYEFVSQHQDTDLVALKSFVHRTFNGLDFIQFIQSLKEVYQKHGDFESAFLSAGAENLQLGISHFKKNFLGGAYASRTSKHVADPLKGSAAKRINMFLRWMVRDNKEGVDFGLWRRIKPAHLSCPLDVHSGNVARKLSLLDRKQNDAKAVKILDDNLRILDPIDPVKYDFALFGLGVYEGF